MNAGRDVERLIAGWLVEEAAPGSPDRVLDATRQVVRRTNQRRFAALWRETMFTPARLGWIAAMLVIALGAGFWIGRATSASGPAAPVSSPTPSASAGVSLTDYRAARNAICNRYGPQGEPLKAAIGTGQIYDASLSAANRAPMIDALTRFLTLSKSMTDELRALQTPAEVTADHLAAVEQLSAINSLIKQELALLGTGDFAGAKALDQATDPLARQGEAFESKYGLAPCP